jgi:uncharacterized protein
MNQATIQRKEKTSRKSVTGQEENRSSEARTIDPIPWTAVHLDGGFLGTRQRINREVSLPIEYEQCKETGRIDAFKLDWKKGAPKQPHHFWDSDVGKWIEAAGYSLAAHPDATLSAQCDGVIDLIASAQQPDGYLNVFFTVVEPGKRWTNLRDMHELYCAGHLIEAAVAYFQGTGKRKLLDVMRRYVRHIDETFGPGAEQQRGYPGHPEIELALMKLHGVTGDPAHKKLAEFFVTERGQSPNYYEIEASRRGEPPSNQWYQNLGYFQAGKPILEQTTLDGHAVRALYLMSGAVDVATATGNKKLLAACKQLWKNVTQKRMYITGGVGSSRHLEKFTFDYDLPNETAYAETCANIALALFAHRLLQIEPSAEYADVIERTLYNGIASGVSLSGDHFFYANPLTIDDEALLTTNEAISARRKPWFGCACCPPNVARIFAWMGQLMYSRSEGSRRVGPSGRKSRGAESREISEIFVHLYASSRASIELHGEQIAIQQTTRYPWDQTVTITVGPPKPDHFTVSLRVPVWCSGATIAVNGKAIKPPIVVGYARISRIWNAGDKIELNLPMPVRMIETNPLCRNNIGKLAVQRGPIVFCAEAVDNPGLLPAVTLASDTKCVARFEPKLLGGVTTISAAAEHLAEANWADALYQEADNGKTRSVQLKLIPYCVWGNRKVGKMQVWFSRSCAR